MKILHISYSDTKGGAARAAYRIHRSVLDSGINSSFRVVHKAQADATVTDWYRETFWLLLQQRWYQRWHQRIKKIWKPAIKDLYSFGKTGIDIVDEINHSDADIVHLHFVADILSVKEIGRIKKPLVWTMHDMWAFCGAEHYAPEGIAARYSTGYTNENYPAGDQGPDLCRMVWEEKQKHWAHQQFHIVGTCRWLEKSVKESKLFGNHPFYLVPYPLDTEHIWRPVEKQTARKALHLPLDKKLVIMGADGGIQNPRKGGDLLRKAILAVTGSGTSDVEVLIFGQSAPDKTEEWGCPVHWLGAVNDDRYMALCYAAADVMVVPSRQEAFGQTTTEAMACGTPVAAFAIGGLNDTVQHKVTGWLAQPFDTDDLAAGILWLLEDQARLETMSYTARQFVQEQYHPLKIGRAYNALYTEILSKY